MLTSFADLTYAVQYGFYCGIMGIVWSTILVDKGMIFNSIDKYLYKKLNSSKQQLEGEYSPLYKIVIGCERCFTGQLALWSYIYFCYNNVLTYSIISHILCVSTGIASVTVIKKHIQ